MLSLGLFFRTHKERLWAAAVAVGAFFLVLLVPLVVRIEHGHIALGFSHADAFLGYDFQKDFIQPLVAWFGTLLMTITAAVLGFAGMLFDTLISWTVVDFGAKLGPGGLNIVNGKDGAVEIAWQIFRDLANIVIIAMFVFVAISTILGIDEFGYKKFLARLLIVAVLINFSLFFTKIAIDISNAFSGAFYAVLARQVNLPQAGQTADAGVSLQDTGGIAGRFMDSMGIGQTWKSRSDVLNKVGLDTGSAWQIIWVALVVSVVMLLLAGVFLYGSFLLASRGILLIFLMISSSIAFASFMVPKFRDHEYGWRGWIDSLIQTTLFGPILMIFLYIVLLIVSSATAARQGTFDVTGFASDPGNPNVWNALIVYMIAVGLLYLSFKFARSFAGQVSAIGYGFKAADIAQSLTLRSAGGLQNRLRYEQSRDAQRALEGGRKDRLNDRIKAGGVTGRIAQVQLNRLDRLAKGKFGIAESSLGKPIVSKFNDVKKSFTDGAGKGGFEAKVKEKDKQQTEKVQAGVALAAPSKEAQRKVFEKGIEEVKNAARQDYQATATAIKKNPNVLREKEQEKKALEEELKGIERAAAGPGGASTEQKDRREKLSMEIKAVGNKIQMTRDIIEKGVEKALNEGVQSSHRDLAEKAAATANKEVQTMMKESKSEYLGRAVPDAFDRSKFEKALNDKNENAKVKGLMDALKKVAGPDSEGQKTNTKNAPPSAPKPASDH